MILVEEKYPEPAQQPAAAGENSATDWIDRIEEMAAFLEDD